LAVAAVAGVDRDSGPGRHGLREHQGCSSCGSPALARISA
jgi:hypothetical protein